MKKILSVIISVVIALWMPMNLLAAEEITQDSNEKSGKISVDYNAGVTYNVTIPASVTFTDAEKSVERGIQASNVVLDEGSSLYVEVSSLNGFKMKNGDGSIDYKLMVNYNTTPKEDHYDILIVHAGESSGWAILDFITELDKRNALYAGKYTDTLTFTVTIK